MPVTKTSKTAADAAQPAVAFSLLMVDEGDDTFAAAHHILDANGAIISPMKSGDSVAISNSSIPVTAASLPLPAGAAADGSDASGVTMPTGGAGIRGWLSGIFNKLNTSIAVTGSFYQATQPVSGTFWQATQPVSASALPLPAGAATAAKQPAVGTAGAASADVLTVQGIASATPIAVSGSFWQATQPVSIAALPALAAGSSIVGKFGIDQTTPGTTNGVVVNNTSIAVTGTFWQATQPVSLSALPALAAGSAVIGKVSIDQTTPGTTNLVAVSKAALTPVVSGANVAFLVIKTGGGSLKRLDMTIGTQSGWLMLFNATAAPADGAVTPIWAIPVDSNGAKGVLSLDFGDLSPLAFSTGCVAVFSSTGPLTKAASPTAFFCALVN